MNPGLLHQTGLTLLHFLWQGAAVAVCLWAVLCVVPVRRADVRYALALGAMAMLCLLPVATFAWMRGAAVRPSGMLTGAVAAVQREALAFTRQPGTLTTTASFDLPTTATFVWAAGVVVLGLRLAAGVLRARQVTRRRTCEVSFDWQERLAVLAEELGITRPVRILASEAVEAPATVGVWRAVVLVPCSFLSKMPEDAVEALLLHELAHIRRHDYLLNIVQTVVETVLFYHPAVWWVSHVVRAERENCCDDIAVGATGDSASYARALTMLEERRVMALAVPASGGHLMKRIRRILNINAPADPAPAARPAALVVTVAMMALAATVLANPQTHRTTTDHGPDTKVTKDVPGDLFALAAPVGDIGSIGRTVKESDYTGKPVPVVKVALSPDLVVRKPGTVKGQAIELSYVSGDDGKSAIVFLDGRLVSPDGDKTLVVTAIPNDPHGDSYSLSLPGALLESKEELDAGSLVHFAVELSSDGSTLILRPSLSPSPTGGTVQFEGVPDGSPLAPRATRAATVKGKRTARVVPGTPAPLPDDIFVPRANFVLVPGAATTAPVAEVQAVPAKARPAKAPRARAAKASNTSSAVAASASVPYAPAPEARYVAVAGSPTQAEEGDPRITLMADGVSISQAVHDLVLQSDVSVLIEPGDYRRVTLFSRGLKAEEALSFIVRAANGVLRRDGKTWIISPRTPKAENKASGSATGR
ncbi:MAG: M56 family metallopeptidase [Fimbriimonadaceae bacterium]|nr:M56 family metallopeptidase [Fimbriimonadaceae bacterium]